MLYIGLKSNICGNILEGFDSHWLDKDPYVKFYGGQHGGSAVAHEGSAVNIIPGYCTKLSDIIEQWSVDGGIDVPYYGHLYVVDVDDSQLLPLPKWVNSIIGYAGPPSHQIEMDILRTIWDLPDYNSAVKKLVEHGIQYQGSGSIIHDVIRSAVPGVHNTGRDGYASEIIVNVPCRMVLISVSDRKDEHGYFRHNIKY